MSDTPQTVSVRFPYSTRQRRLTVAMGCILIGMLIALALLWLLVYQSVIASTEGPPEVTAYNTQLVMSWYGSAGELLEQPSGIAFDRGRRQVFVTDSYRAKIYVLDMAGERIDAFDGGSEEEFRLELPTSIAVAATGQVYVVDAALQMLVIFDEFYHPQRAISFAEEPPKAVTVVREADGDEYLWVLSYSGVARGSLDGDFEWGYFARGEDDGQFANPSDLAGLSDETSTTIFVCDTFNYRVQAFDVAPHDLNLAWIYGGSVEETPAATAQINQQPERLLDLPVSITTDNEDLVFVLDGMGATVVTLDAHTGEFITEFGTVGSLEGQLLYPSAIAYGNDQIWVVDQGNARVSVFSQQEVPPTPRLVRQHFPLELLWLVIALLTGLELGCLLWLSRIRSTRLVFAMDALERIDEREKGAVISDVVEYLNVAPGLETYAQQICPLARVATVSISTRKAAKLEGLRAQLSAYDFDTLVAAGSLTRSVLVCDSSSALFAAALQANIAAVDVTELIGYADTLIEEEMDEDYVSPEPDDIDDDDEDRFELENGDFS